MKNISLQLKWDEEMTEWASTNGLSMNAAINFACRQLLDRESGVVAGLERENAELREKIVAVAMGRIQSPVR